MKAATDKQQIDGGRMCSYRWIAFRIARQTTWNTAGQDDAA